MIYYSRSFSIFYCLKLKKYKPIPFDQVSDFTASSLNMRISHKSAARVKMELKDGTSIAIIAVTTNADFLVNFLNKYLKLYL